MGLIVVFAVLPIVFCVYYVRLKVKNRRKEIKFKKRTWRSKNDPNLTPTQTNKNSRNQTSYFGSIGQRSRGVSHEDSG